MQHQQDIDQLQQCPREKQPMGYKNNKRKKYSDGLEFPEKMVDDVNYSTLQQYTNSLSHASGTHHNHKLRTPLECEGEGVSAVVLNNCSLTIYIWYSGTGKQTSPTLGKMVTEDALLQILSRKQYAKSKDKSSRMETLQIEVLTIWIGCNTQKHTSDSNNKAPQYRKKKKTEKNDY